MSQPYTVNDATVEISASIGITVYPQDDAPADALLRHADNALYRAKEAGRNRYEVFDVDHSVEAQQFREGVARLSNALEQQQLQLYYQPKVNMRTGTVIGAEALVRWLHPTLGLIPPAEFLDYLDGDELGLLFGNWVLDTALDQMEQWKRRGLSVRVSVNVSAKQFQEPGFVDTIRAKLSQRSSLKPDDLEIEVLETTAINDLESTAGVIQALREFGVHASIDDFGTGYSSLIYLKRLPADTLKIDQDFVVSILDSAEDLAIVQGVVSLCSALGRDVIAEGVESEEHGVMLLRLGCDLGQGYGIAKPMPASDFPGWLCDYRVPDSWRKAKTIA
jgi:EAL domain-containing protein (putative c-di-GMP-specific phosphodiesterase class I)